MIVLSMGGGGNNNNADDAATVEFSNDRLQRLL